MFSFETDDKIEGYFSEHGFNDVKFPFAHVTFTSFTSFSKRKHLLHVTSK